MARFVVVLVLVALTAPPHAAASIWITNNARAPSLHVDARGNAEVIWRDVRGVRRTMLVPATGRVLPGGHAGPNVSKPASVDLPLAVFVRRTPDGRLWALQAWRVSPRGPLELHLARWRGESPVISANVSVDRLTGTVTFHGAGMYGKSPTTAGQLLRVTAYLDCFECPAAPGSGWGRMLGVFPRAPDGAFSVFLRPRWQASLYRITVYGKNFGTTYTPDVRVNVRVVT